MRDLKSQFAAQGFGPFADQAWGGAGYARGQGGAGTGLHEDISTWCVVCGVSGAGATAQESLIVAVVVSLV